MLLEIVVPITIVEITPTNTDPKPFFLLVLGAFVTNFAKLVNRCVCVNENLIVWYRNRVDEEK